MFIDGGCDRGGPVQKLVGPVSGDGGGRVGLQPHPLHRQAAPSSGARAHSSAVVLGQELDFLRKTILSHYAIFSREC
jgi:hypothetical protein